MAFPIITLVLALVVAFLGFQTSTTDTGMVDESPASVSAPADDTPAADDAE